MDAADLVILVSMGVLGYVSRKRRSPRVALATASWGAFCFLFLLVRIAYGQETFPAIFVDNSVGATTNSGAPEAFGPIVDLATCHTNGLASTTIQWPTHGITGLSVTGDSVVRLGTPSGRQFSVITAVPDDNTITVADSFNIAAVSAVDCGVGGRMLNAEPELITDMKGSTGALTGWEVHIVETGTNYVWTAARSVLGGEGCGIYGDKDPDGVRPIVECTFQPGTCLATTVCDIKHIEFRNTNATKTGTVGIDIGEQSNAEDNIVGGPAAATSFAIGVGGPNAVVSEFNANLIRNNVLGWEAQITSDSLSRFTNNVLRGNTTGLDITDSSGSILFMGNIFWENGVGIESGNTRFDGFPIILLNTFHDNTTAVNLTDPGAIFSMLFASNLITNNTDGVVYSGGARDIAREAAMVDFNCYGSGDAANDDDIDGFIKGANTISIDPEYEDTVTGDFTPTTTDALFVAWPPGLDGGTPRNFVGTATPSEIVCGAIQPAVSGGVSAVGF